MFGLSESHVKFLKVATYFSYFIVIIITERCSTFCINCLLLLSSFSLNCRPIYQNRHSTDDITHVLLRLKYTCSHHN